MKGRYPVAQWARVALQRVELDLRWGSSSHYGKRYQGQYALLRTLRNATHGRTTLVLGTSFEHVGNYDRFVHPIERLRYVARATHVPADVLARETALALADFVGDDAGLLIACRRILDRQPTSGALVWLVAHVLGAPNQRKALWDAVDTLEDDRTQAALGYELPDDAAVAMVGWSDAIATLARRRGDLSFVLIDTDGNAEYQIDRLTDSGCKAITVDPEGTAQALFDATHLLVNFDGLGPEHGLAPLGTFAAAAVARHLEVPVWGLASTGVALGERMYGGMTRRWNERDTEPRWLRMVEEIPMALIDNVVTTAGLMSPDEAVRAGGCPIVPELF